MIIQCLECKKNIKISLSRLGRRKYCSKKCYSIVRSKEWIGNKLRIGKSPWNKGKPLGYIPKMAFKKGQFALEKHPNWKGGQDFCIDCHKGLKNHRENKKIRRCIECFRKWYKGKNTFLYKNGKPKCEECNKTISYGNKLCGTCCKKGSRSFRWRGGITPINTKIRLSKEYHNFRLKVFYRDKFTCQICKQNYKKRDRSIQMHHIKPFALYPDLRFIMNNAITLCKKCHKKTDTYGLNFKYLTEYFKLREEEKK